MRREVFEVGTVLDIPRQGHSGWSGRQAGGRAEFSASVLSLFLLVWVLCVCLVWVLCVCVCVVLCCVVL